MVRYRGGILILSKEEVWTEGIKSLKKSIGGDNRHKKFEVKEPEQIVP